MTKEERNEYMKAYNEANKDKLNERKKKWYEDNKDKIKEQQKEWKESNKDKIKERKKEYRENNKDKIKEQQKKWYEDNKDKIKERKKEYRENNKDKIKEQQKKYYEKYKDKRNKRYDNRMKTDKNFKLRCTISSRIICALKSQNASKSNRTMKLCGCTLAELVAHLESQFTIGMDWDNHGMQGWHVDHIRPCASFDLTDPEQQKECFHYTNLQPLWWYDNLRKSDKLD